MNSVFKALQDSIYRLFGWLVARCGGMRNLDRVYRLATFMGRMRARLGAMGPGWSRERYLETMRALFPDTPPLRARDWMKAYWINHQKRFLELYLTRELNSENLSDLVSFEGLEHLDSALARGKGVILPVPHIGNERLHHIALAVKGYPLAVISSRYEDHGPYARAVKLDASRRFHEVGHAGDNAWLLRMLKSNRALQVSPDAEADANGVFARYLGCDLYVPTGWLRLALMTGAAVLPSVLLRCEDDRHRLVIFPEFRIIHHADREQTLRENVQHYMDFVSDLVRRHPEQADWMALSVRLEETRRVKSAQAGSELPAPEIGSSTQSQS